MIEFLDGVAQVVVPTAGIAVVLCLGGVYSYLWEIYHGYTPAPRWWSRRYWHGVLVRVICRLAELEAAWEQRKTPRKRRVLAPHVATKRGIVGQRIRRTEYIYIDIVPQTDPCVKGLQVRKVKRY